MNYIKLLRGAPLTVFLAILSLGGVAERREIRKRTGYSYPTIDKACADLAEAGLAVQDNSWEWHILEASPQMILGASKNFLPTTTYINRDSDIESSKTLTEEASKNFLLLKECGVGEPLRTAFAGRHDYDYIAAHVNHWRKEGKPVNVLAHRLKNGDPKPKDPNANKDYTGGAFSDFIEH